MTRTTPILFAVLGLAGSLAAQSTRPTVQPSDRPTIVLVHGAFADGSSFSKVIPMLQRDGYNVIAVQNPLTSLDADVETTKRALAMQTGPVVLVGHSYGGAVITQAAAGNANVKALVYLAAFAPEVGEPIGAFGQQYPAPLGTALKQDPGGFLYVDPVKFHEVFAADLPLAESNVAAAVQKPIIGSVFGASVTEAAWKTIPSWYLVSQEDKAINPDLERFYAKRMKATTSEVKASHVAFISHPAVVVRLIEQAAAGAH
jgi:pimeloyl-ACP methyl ester carboxylesterase